MPEYRPIDGFPGYSVGDDGTVWSTARGRRRQLKPLLDRDGYHRVCLGTGASRHSIHKLVLNAFVGPCPEGMECRHFPDQSKTNNTLANLSWTTRSVNSRDKVANGTDARGEKCWNARLTSDQVLSIRRRAAAGERMASIAATTGIPHPHVCNIVARRIWKHLPDQHLQPTQR